MLFGVNWFVVNGANLPVVNCDGIQDVNISPMNFETLLMWMLLTWDVLDGKNVFTTMDYICASPRCPSVFPSVSWATHCMCFCNAVSDCDCDPWHLSHGTADQTIISVPDRNGRDWNKRRTWNQTMVHLAPKPNLWFYNTIESRTWKHFEGDLRFCQGFDRSLPRGLEAILRNIEGIAYNNMSFSVSIRIGAFFKQKTFSNGDHQLIPKSNLLSMLIDVLCDLRQLSKSEASRTSKAAVTYDLRQYLSNTGWIYLVFRFWSAVFHPV